MAMHNWQWENGGPERTGCFGWVKVVDGWKRENGNGCGRSKNGWAALT